MARKILAIDRSVLETWEGRPVRIATAEGLILLKLLASRPQDLVDIDALLAHLRQRAADLFPGSAGVWEDGVGARAGRGPR